VLRARFRQICARYSLLHGRDEWLFGRWGNDTLLGGDGNDTLLGGAGADIINGGDGSDTLNLRESYVGIRVDLIDQSVNTGIAVGDTYISIENLSGGRQNDALRGDNEANVIFGWDGDDWLHGRGGNDELNGGAGNDVLNGGSGSDTFIFSEGADIVSDFGDDVDVIRLSESLWSGTLTASEVVTQFATVSGSDTLFDFGNGNTLTVIGNLDPANLVDDIEFL